MRFLDELLQLPAALFYRHALGQITWFIHIPAQLDRDVIGKQLERNRCQDRGGELRSAGDLDDIVRNPL